MKNTFPSHIIDGYFSILRSHSLFEAVKFLFSNGITPRDAAVFLKKHDDCNLRLAKAIINHTLEEGSSGWPTNEILDMYERRGIA